MCTAKLFSAKPEKMENLSKSSVLTMDSFVLSRGDEHMGGSYLQSSAVEPPFPMWTATRKRKGKLHEHEEIDSSLVRRGKIILAWTCSESCFDFNGNFYSLGKREVLQASSCPISHIRIFCVLRLQFFRQLQFLLSLVGF